MYDQNLPDEYEILGVPFTRTTRPLSDYASANHALEKHLYDAEMQTEGTKHFPHGYFGPPGSDQLVAAKNLIDHVTYVAEPIETSPVSWDFITEVSGVVVRVPVKLDRKTGRYRPATAIPESGDGVTIDRNGRREPL